MSTDARHRILRLLALRTSPRPRTTRLQLIAITVAASTLLAGIALAQPGDSERKESVDPAATTPVAKADDSRNRDRLKLANESAYVLEPPDILVIKALRLLPKAPVRIQKLDVLQIGVASALAHSQTLQLCVVSPEGDVNLGVRYGRVNVAGLSIHEATDAIEEHLGKRLREPKVSLSVAEKANTDQISGKRLIAPDGYLNLGAYGQVYINGMTPEQAREAIEKELSKYFDKPSVSVEVFAYNSKVYYVIVTGKTEKEDHLHRFPVTGNETVLDALTQVNGVSRFSSKRIWVARPPADAEGGFRVLPVKIDDIVAGAGVATNYQILAGDRIFIEDADLPENRPSGR
jgi:polysaccharide biosynthesis/export protein